MWLIRQIWPKRHFIWLDRVRKEFECDWKINNWPVRNIRSEWFSNATGNRRPIKSTAICQPFETIRFGGRLSKSAAQCWCSAGHGRWCRPLYTDQQQWRGTRLIQTQFIFFKRSFNILPIPPQGAFNLKIYKDKSVISESHIARVSPGDESCELIKVPNTETKCALLASLFLSEGKPGQVLCIKCKRRTGQNNFIASIHESLTAHYTDRTVGQRPNFH